jgi:hypothetical protein
MKQKEKMTTATQRIDKQEEIEIASILNQVMENDNMPFAATKSPLEAPFKFDATTLPTLPRQPRQYTTKPKRGSPHFTTVGLDNILDPDPSQPKYKIIHSSIKLQTLDQLNKIIKIKKSNMNNIVRQAILSYIIQHEDDNK